ncbi:outer membrane beta-barrel protein [Flavobacterium sp. 3HN19-14]|uniref:outer membrane beta-barrel protein n=1 Tax=Flavobacterium sp. 3HN19-14 TaxID=3448133 RepID=UPI003EE3FB4F
MKNKILLLALLISGITTAQNDTLPKIPFEGMDLSWINGQNRQTSFPLTFKDKATNETIVTGVAYLDTYYNYDFNNPKDNTHTISSSIGRSNEFTLNLASIGIETNYKNIIGRLWLQYGQMSAIIQDLDATTQHGRNTSIDNLKNIREASAGYHFNKWYGVNVEMGIFMSYIGLESYVTQENWSYQRSMVCDFTPFYFSGARLQVFPTKKFKTELWLLNGWQSYNVWNKSIGVGNSNYYRPNENLQLVANFYYGNDSRTATNRFHHDNSIVARYFNNKKSKGLSQAAFSLNTHYGFQSGAGVKPSQQYMTGASLSNRLWFNKNKLALALRGDFVRNPGLYLAFTPSPVTPNDFTDDPVQDITIYQGTATFDVMPNDFVTFRLEFRYRKSNKPYFAGRGGTTSPDGWVNTPTNNWRSDLVENEGGVTLAVNFRL